MFKLNVQCYKFLQALVLSVVLERVLSENDRPCVCKAKKNSHRVHTFVGCVPVVELRCT